MYNYCGDLLTPGGFVLGPTLLGVRRSPQCYPLLLLLQRGTHQKDHPGNGRTVEEGLAVGRSMRIPPECMAVHEKKEENLVRGGRGVISIRNCWSHKGHTRTRSK